MDLRLEGVNKAFTGPSGDEVPILADVHLDFRAGARYAIRGRSGSGKSTLLSILGLLDTTDSGAYRVDGADVSKLTEAQRSRLRGAAFGFVFQRFFLVPHLTAEENVATALVHSRDERPRPAQRAAVREALGAVGIADRADHRPAALSGGEQQRVAIARALVKEPRVILADEPSGALDEDTADDVIALLVRVSVESGAGLIVVTHDGHVADAMDSCVWLSHGRVEEPDA